MRAYSGRSGAVTDWPVVVSSDILDILCEPVIILSASFCMHCIFPKLGSLAFVLQTGAA